MMKQLNAQELVPVIIEPIELAEPTAESAVRPRMRRKRGGKDGETGKNGVRFYFHSGTQAAIVAYQSSQTLKEREKLYVTEIMPAFQKLVENLINIHKFSSLYDTYDDLKIDCVNFLFETILKFDSTRGTNAFSYFNVVAKNWLIIRTKQKIARIKKNVSLDDVNAMTVNECRIVEDHCMIPSQDTILENENSVKNIKEMLNEIRSRMKTENELACINSILQIFDNIDELDLLNKGAILLYMRELSGLTPKQLTTTMQSIKKTYKKIKVEKKS